MGFQVPNDLVDTNLSLAQAQEIISNRMRRKTLQNRIDSMPAKKLDLEDMIQQLADEEATMLADAAPVPVE